MYLHSKWSCLKKVMNYLSFPKRSHNSYYSQPNTLAKTELLFPKNAGHRQQWISHKMNNRQPWQLKKSKSWGPFWSYQLNSTANLAHLPRNRAKWVELAVLFSWQLQNGPQDFNFFNCHECQTFILYDIHCYLSPLKS